ncbi:semaphorin-1A-like isoform X2 [Littorina saxatilis]|uniref:Sema domain-containing protein n=1 Tax=Littorina saxatilis TaxID=31220 RepID=A0AAN9GPF3_9CAEN
MECVRGFVCLVLLTVTSSLTVVESWQSEWSPSSTVRLDVNTHSVQRFPGKETERDDFRLLLTEDDSMLVAGRNTIYNISMVTLEENAKIEWAPEQSHIDVCQMRQKTPDECQNYIRVLAKKSRDTLFVCGTNAFKPTCRTYNQGEDGSYQKTHHKDKSGTALCPFDPSHNTTAVYADGKLYSATVADFNSRDPLILESTQMVRTEQFDSKWLNEPNFVSSFEKDDKVYFFFRETAVENINCGKAVFSRVGRVCKQDQGGNILLYNIFTSFFKARLNCSIPGDFPFYFDEIQSTSEVGKGNYRPTYDSGDRSDMVYGVFNTPQNSIHGSAICAFRYSDIIRTFEGRFKGQKSFWHNWLTVPWDDTPQPHPQECSNSSRKLPDNTLNFIKNHPLMNSAVPASGGAPLLVHTSFNAQFTKIAVDWMVHAADEKYYDVMFVGTDDGRVIKAVNKGGSAKIETVVIEDIRVFSPHDPVTDVKVFRDKAKNIEKLIVVSKDNVVSIPLHRCHEKKTCRSCVELRDPYCAWQGSSCGNAERGVQDVDNGWSMTLDPSCQDVTIYDDNKKEQEVTTPAPTPAKCACPTVKGTVGSPSIGPRAGQSSEETQDATTAASASVETLAIAIVVSIVLSMLIGFFIGYKVAGCRGNRDSDASYLERTCSLQRSRNRLSSGEHPYYNPDHTIMPKQMNYVVNVKGKLNTASVETKPVTKSNKVYL